MAGESEKTDLKEAKGIEAQHALYKKNEGILPLEIFQEVIKLSRILDPAKFNTNDFHRYEARRKRAANMAQTARIRISPEISDIYYILRVNVNEALGKPGEDGNLQRENNPRLWSDQRVFAEALLVAGDFPKYRLFIFHPSNRVIFKSQLEKLQKTRVEIS